MTTPPLRKRHFCNDAHRDTTKIARSLEEYRDLREVCHCQHRGRQTCQVQVQNLSSLSAELVTFEPETCHVRAWNLPSPIMALVRFDPATCPVRAHRDRPRSLGKNRVLRDAAALSSLSLEVCMFERGTCQVGASSLSRLSLKCVRLERGTCRARAWRLPN